MCYLLISVGDPLQLLWKSGLCPQMRVRTVLPVRTLRTEMEMGTLDCSYVRRISRGAWRLLRVYSFWQDDQIRMMYRDQGSFLLVWSILVLENCTYTNIISFISSLNGFHVPFDVYVEMFWICNWRNFSAACKL